MDVHQIEELILNMQKLQTKWAEKYPNRARGGRVALGGFRYQFFSFLCSLVSEWVSYDTTQRNNCEKFLSDMETLSDIVTITKSGIIIATQSKITLRSSSLNDALDEFKTIQETLQEECPSLINNIKYRVLCSKVEISDINQALLRWKDKQKRNDPGLDVLNSIEILAEPFPEHRLLAILTNNFKCLEPVQLIHKWLGLIIDGIKSVDTMYFVGRSIWEDLISLWRKYNNVNNSIYVWQDTDFPPQEIRNGSVLIGQRPNVYHLRNGYFSPRVKAYGNLEENFLTMIDSLSYGPKEKVPVFWVGGRSGSGKSVALLHLLSSLFDKGYGPIIWVGHQTSLLCSAVKYAIESQTSAIIGLDDPYVVGVESNVSQHWDEVFALLHSYQQSGNFEQLPIFVACGPTEQAYLFKDDYCEYFEINIKELDKEINEDKDELKAWYYKRTGNTPPDIDDANLLMVQLFFQWDRYQPLQEFSIRLRERLIQGDPSKNVLKLISKILSLNRLYIGYEPAAVKYNLSSEQKDLLAWLENDLHLGERETNGTNKYWLLHAHLANALYLNWYANKPASFTEHLKEAIIDSITFGDTPHEKTVPLWAISRIFRQTSKDELYQRLNEDTIKILLRDVYILQQIKEIYMLPVWVEICSLRPELSLFPSPIKLAVEVIKPESIGQPGLRLLIHKLLQHYHTYDFNLQEKIKDTIVEFVACTQYWNEWLPITKSAITTLKDERLIPIIEKFISKNIDHNEGLAELLYLALKTWNDSSCLINLATDRVLYAGHTFFWIEISKELIKKSKHDLHGNIITWLKVNSNHKHVCFALKEAFPRFYNLVHDIAIAWIREWYELPYASFILEPIIEVEKDNKQVVEWCYSWLSVNNNDVDKSFMIEKLLRTESVSPRIIEIATEWLDNVDSQNPSWLFVWKALNNLPNIDISSFDLGFSWLKQNHYKHKAWPYAWIHLFEMRPSDAALLNMGIEWLKQSDLTNILWIKIIRYTTGVLPNNKELKTLKFEWFKQEDISYNAWPYIWQEFYKDDSFNSDLIHLGKRWLKETNISHKAWIFVWNSIISKYPYDSEITSLGITWLRNIEVSNQKWRLVWETLIQTIKENHDLLELAEKWLKSADYKTAGWEHVWKRLYKSDLVEKSSILELGLVWLTKVDQTHGGWIHIWDSVYKADLSNISLYNMGLNFLRNTNWNTGYWCNVWLLLIKAKPEDVYLYQSGLKWLTTVNIKNRSWQYIWIKLFDLKPNRELIQLGIKWLSLNLNITGAWSDVFNRVICTNVYSPKNFNSLIKQGEIWLDRVPLNHSGWAKTWLNIIRFKPNDSRLIGLGYLWIKSSSLNSRAWSEVWLTLFPHYENDDYLLTEGLDWITLNLQEHECWEKVYKILDGKTTY